MKDAAAFKATIHGLKTIPSRKVVQVTVEAPIEHLTLIAKVAEHGAWVGVARLAERKVMPSEPISTTTSDTTPRPDQSVGVPAGADKDRRKFADMPPAQQFGILCNEHSFQVFLNEKFGYDAINSEEAAEAVRDICKVKSRADIKPDNVEARSLVLAYRLWQHYPEYEEA